MGKTKKNQGLSPNQERIMSILEYKKMTIIETAKNEADLRALKSNKYEKIKSSKTDYSIRINRQYRIELEPLDKGSYKTLLIKRISNHYQ